MATPKTRIERVGDALKRVPFAYEAAAVGRRWLWLARRDRQIARYLDRHEQRYLRLGAGRHTAPGWLSADLFPASWEVVLMDGAQPFPLPSESIDVIQCEHMIEHISYEAGQVLLRECRRVLRPGGVLRVGTPDIDVVRQMLEPQRSEELERHVVWQNTTFGTDAQRQMADNPVFAVNNLMRLWGHTFIYDEATLRASLQAAGLRDIVRVASGESSHRALQGADRHQEEIGEEASAFHTLVLEGSA